MSRWIPLSLLVAALSGAGCSQCQTAQSAILQLDGGAVRCAVSEDCPRTGSELLCVTDRPLALTETCVSCLATQCIRTQVTCP